MREIQLTKGKVALVDDEDYERLKNYNWCWYKNYNVYYVVRNVRKPDGKRSNVRMHNDVMGSLHGFEIDHIDGDGLNNQKSNLRFVTHRQNALNLHTNKASKYPGVSISKRGKPWTAQIRINGKNTRIGAFDTEEEAHNAYMHILDRVDNGLPIQLNKRKHVRKTIMEDRCRPSQ